MPFCNLFMERPS